MSDVAKPEDVRRYLFTTSLDRGGFFRRECPSCGRYFKTKADPDSIAYILQPAFRQSGIELGETPRERDQHVEHLYCPYCKHFTETSNMLTPQLVRFLHRYINREFILPQIRRTFSGLEETFGRNRSRSKGFISINLKFEASNEPLPVRPLSGPEPPDMSLVELLCCNKQIKILSGWMNTINCPYCGGEAVLH